MIVCDVRKLKAWCTTNLSKKLMDLMTDKLLANLRLAENMRNLL